MTILLLLGSQEAVTVWTEALEGSVAFIYTAPPPMSVNTILSATQLNIVSDDLIAIDGKTKSPNTPWETAGLSDLGTGANRASWRGHMLRSNATNVDLEYLIDVLNDDNGGTVETDMVINGTVACTFSQTDYGTTTYEGVKDLDGIVAEGGGQDIFVYFQVRDAYQQNPAHSGANTTTIKWLSQLKTANTGYASFSASRFRDGDTSTVDDDLSRMRSSIMNIDGYAKRGVGGFRARETGDFDVGNGNVSLFDGYVNTIGPGSGVYLVLGFMHDNSTGTDKVVRVKTTFDGTALGNIDWTIPGHRKYENMVTTACTLSCAAATYDVNDKCRLQVTACTTADDSGIPDDNSHHQGKSRVMLNYLAEVPSGARSDWVLPPTFTSGCYALGNSACPSASPQWLSSAASNIEALAGDTARGGYGTDEQSATLPVGRARAVYRFPVHGAGRGYAVNAINHEIEGHFQRIYSLRTAETAYVRAKNAIIKYGPVASPMTHEVDDFNATTKFDTINMDNIGDLEYGMLYYVEVDLNIEDPEKNAMADYLEERFA